MSSNSEVTQVLCTVEAGDACAADKLLPLVYDELRRLAAQRLTRERPGQTLDATALVHAAYVRLVDTARVQQWQSRAHFFAAAAEAMRRILIERIRQKKSVKGGGAFRRHDIAEIELAVRKPEVDLLALNEALDKLEHEDKRQADLVKLRFFAGFTVEQAAEALGVSRATAENDWAHARCWLLMELGESADSPDQPQKGG